MRLNLKIWLVMSIVVFATGLQAQAGSIVGWGRQVVDSAELTQKNRIAISAGGLHSLALRSDPSAGLGTGGSIVGWGYNDSGQATPPRGNNYIAISA
jgi:alpha-tubulin suppressor-like RCC1 family protein